MSCGRGERGRRCRRSPNSVKAKFPASRHRRDDARAEYPQDHPRLHRGGPATGSINLNIKGTVYFMRAFGRIMVDQRGGSLIACSSVRAVTIEPGLAVYGCTKAAIGLLVKGFASEVGGFGVRVNAIAPSIAETALTAPFKQRPDIHKLYAAHTVFNRWSSSDEVAAAVAFLASDASSYVSGSTLFVDGGWTAIDGPPTGLTQLTRAGDALRIDASHGDEPDRLHRLQRSAPAGVRRGRASRRSADSRQPRAVHERGSAAPARGLRNRHRRPFLHADRHRGALRDAARYRVSRHRPAELHGRRGAAPAGRHGACDQGIRRYRGGGARDRADVRVRARHRPHGPRNSRRLLAPARGRATHGQASRGHRPGGHRDRSGANCARNRHGGSGLEPDAAAGCDSARWRSRRFCRAPTSYRFIWL